VIVKQADGTTRVVNETVTQPISPKPEPQQPQKVQVMRTSDGKMSVRGLQPNQKLIQTTDGKFMIMPLNAAGKKIASLGCCKETNKVFSRFKL